MNMQMMDMNFMNSITSFVDKTQENQQKMMKNQSIPSDTNPMII